MTIGLVGGSSRGGFGLGIVAGGTAFGPLRRGVALRRMMALLPGRSRGRGSDILFSVHISRGEWRHFAIVLVLALVGMKGKTIFICSRGGGGGSGRRSVVLPRSVEGKAIVIVMTSHSFTMVAECIQGRCVLGLKSARDPTRCLRRGISSAVVSMLASGTAIRGGMCTWTFIVGQILHTRLPTGRRRCSFDLPMIVSMSRARAVLMLVKSRQTLFFQGEKGFVIDVLRRTE